MRKGTFVYAMMGLVAVLGSTTQAGLVNFVCDAACTFTESGATIIQGIETSAASNLTMTAQANSVFTITTTVTNESSIIWTGYILTLDPAGSATFVAGSGGSTDFGTVVYPDAWTMEFWAPMEVPPGEVVTLEFKLDIPDGAPYRFSLAQNPIPEPATMALLSFGTFILLVRRRR
jgi:hypothetical protein